jgi:hypothetical protein
MGAPKGVYMMHVLVIWVTRHKLTNDRILVAPGYNTVYGRW